MDQSTVLKSDNTTIQWQGFILLTLLQQGNTFIITNTTPDRRDAYGAKTVTQEIWRDDDEVQAYLAYDLFLSAARKLPNALPY